MKDLPSRPKVEHEAPPQRAAPVTAAIGPARPALAPALAFDGLGNRALLSLLRSGQAQRKPAAEPARPKPPDHLRGSGGGQPLEPALRHHFEPLLNRDLSDVRIHTHPQASDLARSLGAVSVTQGQDIAFREGAFNPGTAEGRQLLAHELIHTAQHSPASSAEAKRVSTPGDAAEREAEAGAAALAQGRPFTPKTTRAGGFARQVEGPTATLGRAAAFTQDPAQLKVSIPFPELFQGIDTRGGWTNRLTINATLATSNGHAVAATTRLAAVYFDLWDEDFRVSVNDGPPSRHKTLEQAQAACWSDIAFPASLLVPGTSYVVTGEALLNRVAGADVDKMMKDMLGSGGVYVWLVKKVLRKTPDRADAWVEFRTQAYTAR